MTKPAWLATFEVRRSAPLPLLSNGLPVLQPSIVPLVAIDAVRHAEFGLPPLSHVPLKELLVKGSVSRLSAEALLNRTSGTTNAANNTSATNPRMTRFIFVYPAYVYKYTEKAEPHNSPLAGRRESKSLLL
jgi:hypothetical protein